MSMVTDSACRWFLWRSRQAQQAELSRSGCRSAPERLDLRFSVYGSLEPWWHRWKLHRPRDLKTGPIPRATISKRTAEYLRSPPDS